MSLLHIFPPPFTGEGDREAVEGVHRGPLRFASLRSLSTSPVNGGGKERRFS